MNHATVTVKDTMPVKGFHLGDITVYLQIFFGYFGQWQTQMLDHPFDIVLIQRNRGHSVATVTASFTFEYFLFQLAAPVMAVAAL